tara:strand:- start:228 stop:569 length:342 start_codon:yes stop_codon:yes gene_type:complete
MALSKTGLGLFTSCSASSTTTVLTVASSKTNYVRGILLHNTHTGSVNVKAHIVPNGGSVGTGNVLLEVNIVTKDTYFLEFNFPIILGTNGDTIQIVVGVGGSINALVIGDKDS